MKRSIRLLLILLGAFVAWRCWHHRALPREVVYRGEPASQWEREVAEWICWENEGVILWLKAAPQPSVWSHTLDLLKGQLPLPAPGVAKAELLPAGLSATREAVPLYLALLQSSNPLVRRAAVQGIGRVDDPGEEATAALAAVLDDPDERVRADAATIAQSRQSSMAVRRCA